MVPALELPAEPLLKIASKVTEDSAELLDDTYDQDRNQRANHTHRQQSMGSILIKPDLTAMRAQPSIDQSMSEDADYSILDSESN